MESAIFLRNFETEKFEVIGRISAESEEAALARLGETGVIRKIPVASGGEWYALAGYRFAVGLYPDNFQKNQKTVSLLLTSSQISNALMLGADNFTEGVRLALRMRATGAGLPKLSAAQNSEARRPMSVRLWKPEVDLAEDLGGGNISAGIRLALGG